MFQMHGKRWIITIIIGIIFITSFRLAWLQTLTILDDKNPPSIHEGVLDLRDWEFSSYRTMPLNGV